MVCHGANLRSAPTLPVTATALETNLETDLSFADPLGAIGNLLGLPAISVPCGFKNKTLPISIEFLAQVPPLPAAHGVGLGATAYGLSDPSIRFLLHGARVFPLEWKGALTEPARMSSMYLAR